MEAGGIDMGLSLHSATKIAYRKIASELAKLEAFYLPSNRRGVLRACLSVWGGWVE